MKRHYVGLAGLTLFLNTFMIFPVNSTLRAEGREHSLSPQAPVTGKLKTANTIEVKTSTSEVSTNSTYDQDVPDMEVTFRTTGNINNSVIVSFTSEVTTAPGETAYVSARLDGTSGNPGPGSIVFDKNNPDNKTHSFNFLFNKVAPGKHTVKIIYRSGSGGLVSLFYKTLLVYHK